MGTLANNRNIHKKPRNIRKGENNEYPKMTKHKLKTTQQRNRTQTRRKTKRKTRRKNKYEKHNKNS